MEDLKDIVITENEGQTIAYAAAFARTLKKGDIVAFYGDLGAGKSVFCRSVIRTLCNDAGMDVPSPTYTIVQNYDAQDCMVSHFDLYRLADPQEIYEIGWEEYLSTGIVLIEWPSRLGAILPEKRIDIIFLDVPDHPDCRKIESVRHERSNS